jgi:hypothetical protein
MAKDKTKDPVKKVNETEQKETRSPLRLDKMEDVEVSEIFPASWMPEKRGGKTSEKRRLDRTGDERTAEGGRGLGITSLILSIISFFFWPFILAAAGIILGAIAIRRGSALGWWGVGLGIISVIVATIVLPIRLIF